MQVDNAAEPRVSASALGQTHAGGLRWRFWRAGRGPQLLLLHGTGASGDAWRAVAQQLQGDFEVLCPDLPGHGGSSGFADHRATLPRMAQALAALLRQENFAPALVAGHSAGAALMLQWAFDGSSDRAPDRAPARVASSSAGPGLRGLLGLNAALQPLPGLAAVCFPPLARGLARWPWLRAQAAAQARRPEALARLIASTGSRLPAEAVSHYGHLLANEAHVQGALDMMAHWDLAPLLDAAPRWPRPLWLLAGTADATVPAAQSVQWAHRLPQVHLELLDGLGHLAHEEAPGPVSTVLRRWALACGVLQPSGRAADTAADKAPAAPSGSAT